MVAVIAPVIGAVVIGVVLSSPFMLLFAALGPIVALGGVADARRTARRQRRLEAERFDRECVQFDRAIDDLHSTERLEACRRAPHPAHAGTRADAAAAVRIGTAPASSSIGADVARPVGDSDAHRRLVSLLARAQRNPVLPALIPRGPLVVEGRGLVADVMCRQLGEVPGVSVHRHPLDDVDGSCPAAFLDAPRIVATSATSIELHGAGAAVRRVRPEFVSQRQLDSARAVSGLVETVPDSLTWGALRARSSSEAAGGGVPIGAGDSGVVAIDLVRSGPHALVGGTTGSGKSELLRAMALGWAAASPPTSAQLLFVDFKGGATFARLTDLPHTIGLVTDLDPVVAHRAVRSLRAELRHRERTLTEAGLRDLRERPALLPRLLVLVDEFATLVETFPELHAVFADVAARGRSLGVHLVLCTQHPASVVRDSIAANCPVRLSFRVTEAASGGIVGERARELVAAPPGRALLVDEQGVRRLQVAVIADDDIDQVLDRWREHTVASSTWCPPLPERLRLDDDPSIVGEADPPRGEEGESIERIVFGVLDDPDERCRQRAVWSPRRDGALAVLGASRSGRSMLLATLASGAPEHAPVLVLPTSVPDAWHVLEHVTAHPPGSALLVCDGLDDLLARAGDRASELITRWDAAVRAVRTHGGAVAASLASASAAGALLGGRFESRVILRCADADEHAVCGAPRGLFDRAAPAGRGWWRDLQLQVAIAEHPLPVPQPGETRSWHPDPDRDAIVISTRAADVARRVASAGLPHRVVADPNRVTAASIDPADGVSTSPRVIVAAPVDWQAAWSVLAAARTRIAVLLDGVDAAEVRSLFGGRESLPPIDAALGECWLAEPGRPIVRARWPLLSEPPSP